MPTLQEKTMTIFLLITIVIILLLILLLLLIPLEERKYIPKIIKALLILVAYYGSLLAVGLVCAMYFSRELEWWQFIIIVFGIAFAIHEVVKEVSDWFYLRKIRRENKEFHEKFGNLSMDEQDKLMKDQNQTDEILVKMRKRHEML